MKVVISGQQAIETSKIQAPLLVHSQRGQALISGLILLVFVAVISIYFLLVTETAARSSERMHSVRSHALRDRMRVAEILNQISINNKNILVANSIAGNSFAEAMDYSLKIAATTPGWVTNSIDTQAERLFKAKREDDFDDTFRAFAERSARGYQIAQGYTLVNRKLKEALEGVPGGKKIASLLHESSRSETICFAMRLGVVTGTLSFNADKCEFSYGIPFTSDILSFSFFSFKKRSDSWERSSELEFGALLPEKKSMKEFILGLRGEETSEIGSDFDEKTGHVIARWLSNITLAESATPDRKFADISETELKKSPLKLRTAVTHPSLRMTSCGSKKSGKDVYAHTFLSEKDWKDFESGSCEIDNTHFVRSFFMPHWTPLLISQERAQ
jgi:hypothetical protein